MIIQTSWFQLEDNGNKTKISDLGVATLVGANQTISKQFIHKVRWEPTVGGSELDGLPKLERYTTITSL